ncbi:hypothetical protein [Streptomyces sp. NPDC015680]|uniref:hypothetical protein n=1 Tax=unclassified Streptomyces TaxID=2593676 RepID=UPI0036FB0119
MAVDLARNLVPDGLWKIAAPLSFHFRVGEAEAMAAERSVAAALAGDAPGLYPPVERVWADWLYGARPPPGAVTLLRE